MSYAAGLQALHNGRLSLQPRERFPTQEELAVADREFDRGIAELILEWPEGWTAERVRRWLLGLERGWLEQFDEAVEQGAEVEELTRQLAADYLRYRPPLTLPGGSRRRIG